MNLESKCKAAIENPKGYCETTTPGRPLDSNNLFEFQEGATPEAVLGLVERVRELEEMLNDLKTENEQHSRLLTQINNLIIPYWAELRELRRDCQTWEQCWENKKKALKETSDETE